MEPGLDNIPKRRTRSARGFVLLVLLAHAFFVSATHFHRVAGFGPSGAPGASLGRADEGRQAPLRNGEEQCLVCRLQRNFTSGLMRHAPPQVAPSEATPDGFAALRQTSAHAAHRLSATGRAPPLS